MEFKKGPLLVSAQYREAVQERLKASRVTYSGYFNEFGEFDIVKLGEKTEIDNTNRMWAYNLLGFAPPNDGIRTTKDGLLHVYTGRMTRNRGDIIDPIATIAPGNVRFVDTFHSFVTTVGESGWLFDENTLWRYKDGESDLSRERFEEILVEAEVGKKPPFFDHNLYMKVEPGFAHRLVHVIRFSAIGDGVVLDIENRQLVERYTEAILSSDRWVENREAESRKPQPASL